MSEVFADLETPALLLDKVRLQANIRRMQSVADAHAVELWPHIKTHKMTEVARMQLASGARGITCAKTGEAEAMLPSGVRRIFIAHSLVSPQLAPRLKALAGELDELILSATSESQAEAMDAVLTSAGLRLPVMVAIDTGLHREGARSLEEARRIVARIKESSSMTFRGFYTHEGHAYTCEPEAIPALAETIREQLCDWRDAIDPAAPVWPGCSVTAALVAGMPGIQAIRPGAYVFGDLWLSRITGIMAWEHIALTVLATVIDKPEKGLALIDAGSKVFSGDKTTAGEFARSYDGSDLVVTRCSEEHGFLQGADVDALQIGQRVRLVPAHVCPCINLADSVCVLENDTVTAVWKIEARGRVR